MTSAIHHITVDCADPYEVATFWAKLTGYPADSDAAPGVDDAFIELPGGPILVFARVPEPKVVKNRMHLCLRPDVTRDAEVERAAGLGARIIDDRRRPDGKGWVVLADPEGNEFCVLRSAGERHAAR